jgi:hypothetical protein
MTVMGPAAIDRWGDGFTETPLVTLMNILVESMEKA